MLDYIFLFSSNEYEKNDKIIVKCFHWLRWKNYLALFVVSMENLKILKYHTFLKKY